MYFSAKEILAQLEGTDKRICDLVIQNETELFETPYDKIMEMLEERYQIMYNSAHDALEREIALAERPDRRQRPQDVGLLQKGLDDLRRNHHPRRSLRPVLSGSQRLDGPDRRRAHRRRLRHPAGLPAHRRGKARHPTPAGAGGPGNRFGHRPADRQKGDRLRREGGCQAECGSAAAMAAGAVVEMLGGTPAQAFDAAAIAMQNIMGLVCDPVAGLVEMPCAKRNASGVANALVSADLALSGIFSEIPFDEVVEAMYKVGKALPSTLRETALGGVATTPTALAMKEKIYGKGAAESACSGDCASCGLC